MKGLIPILTLVSLLFSRPIDYQTELCTHTFAGDFYLRSNDTLREDVSVSGGNAQIDGVIDGDLAVMGGSVTINGTIDGDVAVFGGEIENNGVITGDAAVAGGSVKNKGKIEGDIAVAGGSVELDSNSVVEGDIAIVGGGVDRSDHAVVKGEITALDIGKLDKIMPRIKPLLRWHRGHSPLRQALFEFATLGFILVMFILGLIIMLVFPAAIDKITGKIKKNIWVAVAIGIGIEILFVPLIILFAISIIGIPIIPAFILAVFIAILFGLSAFSIVLGERICYNLNWQIKNRIGIYTMGYLPLVIVFLIGLFLRKLGFLGVLVWILGIAIIYVAGTIGLGSVVYALIKKEK
uniref:Polymer-forming cytoskeletal protein n=1 Tax=candidate division WOR-3 bacterium TaxID=2052148 RepID=A0A7C4TCQ2_UNCW3